jgi:hypothetical protein
VVPELPIRRAIVEVAHEEAWSLSSLERRKEGSEGSGGSEENEGRKEGPKEEYQGSNKERNNTGRKNNNV